MAAFSSFTIGEQMKKPTEQKCPPPKQPHMSPLCGQTDTCKNITFANFVCKWVEYLYLRSCIFSCFDDKQRQQITVWSVGSVLPLYTVSPMLHDFDNLLNLQTQRIKIYLFLTKAFSKIL